MDNKENWQNIIKAWQKSGEKQIEWCKQKGINISTFKYWKYRLKKETANDIQFQELEAIKPRKTTNPSPKSILIEIADAKIEVYDDINPHLLRTIIQVLKSC